MYPDSLHKSIIQSLVSIRGLDEKKQTLLKWLINKIKHAQNSGQLAYYLSRIRSVKSVEAALSEEAKSNIVALQQRCITQSQALDSFGNNQLNAEFESMLSKALLEHAPTDSLVTINRAIVDYLRRHKQTLLDNNGKQLKNALINYKIPYDNSVDEVEALITLLERPLDGIDRAQVISETMTLHLLFFNYQHIYQPELDYPEEKRKEITLERDALHNIVRPKNKGEMFDEETRGRITIQSKKRSTTLGITDDQSALDEFLNFHRHEFTPHKYRAKAHENSSIVKAFREHGISYISGPSGTAADCLEGLHFLLPNFSFKQYEQYLNLLSAAETAQGHHSMHEVMLTALNLKVLPKLNVKTKHSPVWNVLPYGKTYDLFLSKEFKALPVYQHLIERYPQYLDYDALVNADNQREKSATVIQREIRSLQAAKDFRKSTYWQKVDARNPEMQVEQSVINFTKARSKKNLDKLRKQLGPISQRERRFLRFFMAQDFDMTHYTNAISAILSSGHILSNNLLQQQYLRFVDHSSNDIDELKNGQYVFYRMELSHKYYAQSRFGQTHIIVNGRNSGLLEYGIVSLFEMLMPRTASVLRKLKYHGKKVRFSEDSKHKDEVQLTYPKTGKTTTFSVADTIFHGRDIMPGIAYAMIRELRNIGGDLQEDFLSQFDRDTMDVESAHYQKLQQSTNDMLSNLFRIEAKMPGKTVLSNPDIEVFDQQEMDYALRMGDTLKLRALLTPKAINKKLIFNNMTSLNALDYAILSGYELSIPWLKANGAISSIESSFEDFFTEQFLKYCTVASLKARISLLPEFTINMTDNWGKTLLHHIGASNRLDLISAMVELGSNVDMKDDDNKTFMDYVSLSGYLQSRHVNIKDLKDFESQLSFDEKDEDGNNLLHIAISCNHAPEIINFLSSHGVAFDEKNNVGETPLEQLQSSIIVKSKDDRFNKLIMAYFSQIPGLDINFKVQRISIEKDVQETLLLSSINNKNYDLVIYCLSQGAEVSSDAHNALILMAKKLFNKSHSTVLHKLIELYPQAISFIDMNATQSLLENNMLEAFISSSPELEQQIYSGLIENSDSFMKSATPAQLTKVIVEYPQLSKTVDSHGETLLFHAARAGRTDLFTTLEELGVDSSQTNNQGEIYTDKIGLFPLVKTGNLDEIKRIISHYPKITLSGEHKGMNLLHYAVKYMQLNVIDFLHEQGFSFDATDAQGVTAAAKMQENLLDKASFFSTEQIIDLFSRYAFLSIDYQKRERSFLEIALRRNDVKFIFLCLEHRTDLSNTQKRALNKYLGKLFKEKNLSQFKQIADRFPQYVDEYYICQIFINMLGMMSQEDGASRLEVLTNIDANITDTLYDIANKSDKYAVDLMKKHGLTVSGNDNFEIHAYNTKVDDDIDKPDFSSTSYFSNHMPFFSIQKTNKPNVEEEIVNPKLVM